MPNLGPMELGIILVIVVIIFGVGKLPEIGGALGKGIREFKQESTDDGEAKDGDAKIDAGTSTTASNLTNTTAKAEEKVPTSVGSRADEI